MDSSQLYELSLAVGQSSELSANCDRFLSALTSVKQLSFSSVWLKNRLLLDADVSFGKEVEESVVLVYANPRERFDTETISLDHPIFSWLAKDGMCSLAPPDSRFSLAGVEKRLHQGAVAIFALGELGFLKLHSQYRNGPFSDAELTELSNVVFKFTISIEGCLAHHRLQREVILRNRAEAAVRLNEEHFRSLIENALDIIMVLDYDGTIQFASPSCERLLGYEPSELTGQSLFEYNHPDEMPHFLRNFQTQVRIPGIAPPLEFQFRHSDGSWRSLSASTNNLLAVPSVAGIIMNCHDVTERNEIQTALHRSEERYSLSVQGANDGIWDWDLKANEIYFSSRWKAMLGFDEDEISSTPATWIDRVHPEDRAGLKAAIAAERPEGTQLFQHRYRMQHKDGSWRWMLTRGIAVHEGGGETRMAGSQTDVTERIERNAELEKARREALNASRAKGEFLANMSHEIRTPMNGVIGMTNLLLETGLNVEQREYSETIRASGQALLRIVSDILDFSKIESGKLDIEHLPLDLRSCIEGALDLVASAASDKGIELAYWMNDTIPAALLGDGARIRQILVNLLGNAVKFTDEGGVLVSLRSTTLDDGKIELHFAIKDTGIGIPEDKIGKLFQPFSQADASTTRKYGGTGLGLAICTRLSELMGGRIWVESESGRGSTFHFTIACALDPDADVVTDVDTSELAGSSLLIVASNPTLRQVLTLQTLAWGVDARVAGSPAEAIDRLGKGERFDAAILDYRPPEMDGIELARLIRGMGSEYSDLPLLLLIPLGLEKPADAEVLGFADLVAKPAKPRRLRAALTEILVAGPRPSQERPVARRAPLPSAGMPALRILLAEDNMINQKVALLTLKRLGFEADAVVSGTEVLQALLLQAYDVILMDVQMPEMDGLEATRRIRAEADRYGVPRIIAMTAHAMAGDRDRCLEAGMDEYLSKPIDMDEVRNALIGVVPTVEPEPESAQPEPAAPVIDQQRIAQLRTLAESLSSDLLAELVDAFLEGAERDIAALRQAMEAGKWDVVKRTAHGLKGSSLNLGATEMVSVCRALEQAEREGRQQDIAGLLTRLDSEFVRARLELENEKSP